jgi:hypothetical protein
MLTSNQTPMQSRTIFFFQYNVYHKYVHGSLNLILIFFFSKYYSISLALWKYKYKSQTQKVKPKIKCITIENVYNITFIVKMPPSPPDNASVLSSFLKLFYKMEHH